MKKFILKIKFEHVLCVYLGSIFGLGIAHQTLAAMVTLIVFPLVWGVVAACFDPEFKNF